jgi:PWWP domain
MASADARESDEWSSDDEVHKLPLERRQRFGGMLDHGLEAVVGVVHARELYGALYEFVCVFLRARRCRYGKKVCIADVQLAKCVLLHYVPRCVSLIRSSVWAKQTGFPAWPAIIWDPRFLDARMQKLARHSAVLQKSDVVWFYGANPSFGVVPLT